MREFVGNLLYYLLGWAIVTDEELEVWGGRGRGRVVVRTLGCKYVIPVKNRCEGVMDHSFSMSCYLRV